MRPRKSLLFLTLLSAILVQRSDLFRDRIPAVEVLWRFDAGGCLTHTPTPAGDVVYVASGNGIVWQLERATGKARWIAMMGRNSNACMFRGPLMLTSDLVLAGTGSRLMSRRGRVRALEQGSGQQRWAQSAGLGLAPSMSRLGTRVFVPTVDGELLSLSLDSGTVQWRVPLTVGDWGSPAVAVDRVFTAAADGSVLALEANTGREIWRSRLQSPISTAIRRGKSALFVGTYDGFIHRIAMDDGRILASRRVDNKLAPRGALVVDADSLIVQLADGRAENQVLVSIDRFLKRVSWRIAAVQRWSTSRVFAWKNTVAVGTTWGKVLAYCASSGRPAWTHEMAGTIRAISGAGDVLYIGTTDGLVEAVRPPASCRDAYGGIERALAASSRP